MQNWNSLRLEDFLACRPGIRLIKINGYGVELAGEYHLKAQHAGCQIVEKTYRLRIVYPRDFPHGLPKVFDVDGYFPRSEVFHTYEDGSFCLGSELRIKSLFYSDHTITTFFENIVDPFLYAVSHRIEFGDYPFGDLSHGEKGLIEDYAEMLGLQGKFQVVRALQALGMRKRDANKMPCPCGCGQRLGRCDYRFRLNRVRDFECRRWFRKHLKELFTPLIRPSKGKKKAASEGKQP